MRGKEQTQKEKIRRVTLNTWDSHPGIWNKAASNPGLSIKSHGRNNNNLEDFTSSFLSGEAFSTRMCLPGENLSLIVRFALQGLDHGDILPHRAAFSLLTGFSLASHKFRQIALREAFRTYHVVKPSQLHDLHKFPDLYKCIRVLHCSVAVVDRTTKGILSRFTFLRALHLRVAPSDVVAFLQCLPDTVQEMSLPFDHSNDHAAVLETLSRFTNLQFLRVMSCRFEVAPVMDVPCENVPPHHYNYSRIAAQMLKPLVNLRVLQIDHYLTDSEVFEYHTTQCPWNSASSAFCPTCWDRFGEQTASAEITCTEIMARGLPNLEAVLWMSWFTLNAEGHSKVSIIRNQSRSGYEDIQIRRERDPIEAAWKKLRAGTHIRRGLAAS